MRHVSIRSFLRLLAVALLLGVPGIGSAQPVGKSMHLESWSSLANQYVFRGIPQVSEGAMMQGGAEIRADLVDDGWLRVSVPIGFFLQVNPKQPSEGVPNVPRAWYESRFDGGVILGFGGASVDSRFRIYASPNGSFQDVYELDFDIAYDDEELFTGGDDGRFFRGFHPHLLLARELIGARDGGVEGTFLGVSLRPRARLLDGGPTVAIDASLPLEMGFSAGDYYEMPVAGAMQDQAFGYASVGAAIDMELRFMPRRLGLWSSGFVVNAIFPAAVNASRLEPAADGSRPDDGADTVHWVFTYWGKIAF